MQLIVFFTLYDTPVPANIEVYNNEFRKFVSLEIIKPINILRRVVSEKTF